MKTQMLKVTKNQVVVLFDDAYEASQFLKDPKSAQDAVRIQLAHMENGASQPKKQKRKYTKRKKLVAEPETSPADSVYVLEQGIEDKSSLSI